MNRKDDLLWKDILEHVFDDFLRFMHPGAAELLDLEKGFVFLDKELDQVFPHPEGAVGLQIADKLVRVYTREGGEEWILVHVEVQEQYRQDFSRRMFRYFYRILDKYGKRITAYAIFTGPGSRKKPDAYELSFMGTTLVYRYNIYQVAAQQEQALLNDPNPFALVVLAAKTALKGKGIRKGIRRDAWFLPVKIRLLKNLLSRKTDKGKIRALMEFITACIQLETAAIQRQFSGQVKILTQNHTAMETKDLWIEEVRKEGELRELRWRKKVIREGKVAVVKNLLSRFGFTPEQAAEAAGLPLQFVQWIARQQLSAEQ